MHKETLEEFIQRLQDAGTTLQLFYHTSELVTRAGKEDLVLIAHNLTSILRYTNSICESLSLFQTDALFLVFTCPTRKTENGSGCPQIEVKS